MSEAAADVASANAALTQALDAAGFSSASEVKTRSGRRRSRARWSRRYRSSIIIARASSIASPSSNRRWPAGKCRRTR